MIDSYPLSWPADWPRNHDPDYSNFKTGLVDARNGLIRELGLLKASDIVISSNAALNRDGSVSYRQGKIDDTGAAAYFTLNGEQRCIPCDKWIRLEDNLHAIELTVGALRGLDRWGAKEMVDAAFRGFAALPAGGQTSGEHPLVMLGLDPANVYSRDEIELAYRRLAKTAHPDAPTGSDAAFRQLKTAYEQAKASLQGGR